MHRAGIVVFVVALMITAPMGGVVVGASPTTDSTVSPSITADSTDGDYDNVHETDNDNVSVWDRTPLPLRADTSDGATVVDNQNLRINNWDGNEAPLGYEELAIYNASDDISIDFDDVTGASLDQYEGQNATVIAGQLSPDVDDPSLTDVPSTVDEFQELFGEERLEEVNDNVTFKEIDSKTVDADGFETAFKPDDHFDDGVGQYVVLVAVEDEAPGLEVVDGDLDPQGHSIIAGVEGILAQSSPSSVSVDAGDLGDDVTFTIDDNLDDEEDIHHVVALYDKDKIAGEETTINITESPDEDNFSVEDHVIIESDIGHINGVADLEAEMPLADSLFADSKQTGTMAVPDILTFLDGDFEQDAPEFDGGNTTLDASIKTAVDPEDDEITLETFGNWSESDYQWVHLAATEDGSDFTSSADTISLEEEDTGIGIPAPPPDDDPKPTPGISVVETDLSTTTVEVDETFYLSVTLENEADEPKEQTLELTRDGEVIDEQKVTLEGGETKTVTFEQTIADAGSYEYAISGHQLGMVSATEPEPAAFETSNTYLSDSSISAGETIEVTATVENVGGETGTHTAELVIDGEVVATQEVTLDPGESEVVTFTYTFDDDADYEMGVDDQTIGSLIVEDDSGISTLGFVIGLTLVVAIAGGALYLARTHME